MEECLLQHLTVLSCFTFPYSKLEKMKEPDFVNKQMRCAAARIRQSISLQRIYIVLPTPMLQILQYFYMVFTGRKDAKTGCQVG
jgi:hypothetical protein